MEAHNRQTRGSGQWGAALRKSWLAEFALTFATTLLVSTVVTFVWNLATRAKVAVEWEPSFALAIVLGIALPLVHSRRNGRRG